LIIVIPLGIRILEQSALFFSDIFFTEKKAKYTAPNGREDGKMHWGEVMIYTGGQMD